MIDTTWVRVYNSKAFYVANQIAATGNITAYYSDIRFKTKTGKIENALDKVEKLEGFYYVENELAKSLGYNNDKQQVAWVGGSTPAPGGWSPTPGESGGGGVAG